MYFPYLVFYPWKFVLPDRLDQNNVRFSRFISLHTCLHYTLIDICSIAFCNTAINAWQNLMYTVSVNLAGYDGVLEFSITLVKDRLQTMTELFSSRDREIRMKSLLVKFIHAFIIF